MYLQPTKALHCITLFVKFSTFHPSDHSVRRPRAEIRTRVEGSTIEVGMLNTRPQLLAYSFDVFRLYCHNQTMPMPSRNQCKCAQPRQGRTGTNVQPMPCQVGEVTSRGLYWVREGSHSTILQYAPELQHWSSTTGS